MDKLNKEQKAIVIQSCQMQITALFHEYGDELSGIDSGIIVRIFNAGVKAALNATQAVISDL